MELFYYLRNAFVNLFKRRRLNNDLEEEMQHHLAMDIEHNVQTGMSETEARQAARREFGHLESLKEECRDSWGSRAIFETLRNVRFAVRMLLKHRCFSATVIVTIALSIGINTTVFTLVNTMLFKPLPIPRGERLLIVKGQNLASNSNSGISLPDFQEFQIRNHTFEQLEAHAGAVGVISESGNPPELYNMSRVSSGFLSVLQALPILGRPFSPANSSVGAETVILISHSIWQSRYAGAADVVGRSIRLNEAPATIIGVMPENFRFPNVQDLWIPLQSDAQSDDRSSRGLALFGILKLDTPIELAQQDLTRISQELAITYPDTNENMGVLVQTFKQASTNDVARIMFLTMLGAVAFVLIIACANIANMMLGRSLSRNREISIRAAMGASRSQIIRQLLVESILLSSLGGILGLALGLLGLRIWNLTTSQIPFPYWLQFNMDWVAFTYFAGISLFSGVIFGLVPAIRASRVDLNTSLKEGPSSGGSSREGWLSGTLIVMQFAFALVLLTGAGVMVRSYLEFQKVNDFVPAENLLMAQLTPPQNEGERYHEPESRTQLYTDSLERIRALPGVIAAAAASHAPGLGAINQPIEIDGSPIVTPGSGPRASMVVQTPGYFKTVDLPILQGRSLELTDGRIDREVAIVTRQFAGRFWPTEDAIGQRFRLYNADEEPSAWMTVVGICADIEQTPTTANALPAFFIPYEQQTHSQMKLLVRTLHEPTAFTKTIRAVLQEIDQDLPLSNVMTLQGERDRLSGMIKIFGSLFLIFAILGLLIASVGIYGVVTQATARRTREIGLRMALGSTAGRIIKLVLTRSMRQLALGLALGLVGSYGITSVLGKTGFLVDGNSHDPLVFISTAGLLVAVGIFACWLPAHRAAKFDPMVALRHD